MDPADRFAIGFREQVMRALLPILAVACLAGCGGNPEADAGAIRALVDKEVAAINAEDLQELAQVWSETREILLFDVPPPNRFEGWNQVGRVFQDFFDRFSEIQLSVDAVKIGVDGDLGYASYDWALAGTMGESEVRDRGQATSIYRREESGWRLVHAHYSPVPAAVALDERSETGDGAANDSGAAPASGAPGRGHSASAN